MNKLLKKPRNDKLYEAILSLNSVEECKQFLEDLCSEAELSAMEQRYQVARLLLEDKVYLDILLETKASTSTISRVKRMVTGGTGCIKRVIQRINPELADK
jgi:TrpR-related protein YerC/YecD